MLETAVIVATIWILEWGKFNWHQDVDNWLAKGAHIIGAATLMGASLFSMSIGGVIAIAILYLLFPIEASHRFLRDREKHTWWVRGHKKDPFHILSALSSWPVEVGAIASVALLHGYVTAILCAILAGYPVGFYWALDSKRPKHWTPSNWHWLYPFKCVRHS